MRYFAILLALVLAPVAASAQQTTPSELAIQIDSAVNQLAGAVTAGQKQLTADQKQIQDQQKQIADLTAKLAEKTAPKKDAK